MQIGADGVGCIVGHWEVGNGTALIAGDEAVSGVRASWSRCRIRVCDRWGIDSLGCDALCTKQDSECRFNTANEEGTFRSSHCARINGAQCGV